MLAPNSESSKFISIPSMFISIVVAFQVPTRALLPVFSQDTRQNKDIIAAITKRRFIIELIVD
jgi:hypothetical protein